MMPSNEIGTPQPFEQWETLTFTEYAVVGQFGFRGYQPTPATPTMDMNTLNSVNALNQIANAINSFGKLTVKYMKISWNQTGTTVTDFVFGMVANMKKPVNVLDLWSMLPANLVQAFAQLNFTGDAFQAYLLGLKQSAYTYTWNWGAYSSEYFIYMGSPPTDADLKASFLANGKIGEALAALVAEAAKSGCTITIRSYDVTSVHAEFLRTIPGGNQGVDKDVYRTNLVLKVDFDSNIPLTASPIAPFIVLCIGIAILVIASAVFVYFNNISTYSSKVTSRITNNTDQPITVHTPQGDVTIPPHSEWEYTEDVSGGGASWIAQLPLIFVGIGAVIVLAVVLPKVFTSKERR